MCLREGKWWLIGILSKLKDPLCATDSPAIFTFMPAFSEWLQDRLGCMLLMLASMCYFMILISETGAATLSLLDSPLEETLSGTTGMLSTVQPPSNIDLFFVEEKKSN